MKCISDIKVLKLLVGLGSEKMGKYLVFDFDGVIINSHGLQEKALEESYRKVVGEGEVPYRAFFQNSGDSLSNIFRKLNLPQEMVPVYTHISASNLDMIRMNEGMRNVLNSLQDNGYKLALCTGKERKRTIEILKHLEIKDYFATVVCSDDVEHPKPCIDSLVKCIENMDGTLGDAIMIGDGVNDIICARNAGVYSIGVTWGDTEQQDIIDAKPDAIATNVLELFQKIVLKFTT